MSEKEKLVDLLDEAHDDYYKTFDPTRNFYETIADYLLANGVHLERKQATSDKTSKWEPIIDPPPSGDVMAYSKKSGGMAVGYIEPHYSEVGNEFICANGLEPLFDVTHWMPLPEPPEEVET